MTITETIAAGDVHTPDRVARQIVLPEGHRDDVALFEAYRWLRENNPLARVEVEGYDPVWLVAKHADIAEIGRQPAVFTNGGGAEPGSHNPVLHDQAGDAFTRSLTGGSLRVLETLVYLDPPEHTAVRAIASEWFRPVNLTKWDGAVRDLARAAIAKHLRPGHNDIDFVQQFATHYPLHVIMSLFGVPEADEPLMMTLTQDLFGTNDPNAQRADVEPLSPTAAAEQWSASIQDFYAYFDDLVEARRAHPRDDLATIIANARMENGDLYPREVAYGWFIAIATAGHDTTSSTLAGGIEALAQHPDQLRRVREEPALIPHLVNESLRWVSPIKHFMRRAAKDYVLRDRQIREGDRMMLLYQSANRDPDVFDDPDTFRIDRQPNKHIAMGHGPHNCIGQYLAKQELRIMFEELLPRLESLEITGARKVVQANFVGGLRNLPVTLVLRPGEAS